MRAFPRRRDERARPRLSASNCLHTGDLSRMMTSGGGGLGHPFEGDRVRVEGDVEVNTKA